MEGPRGYEGKEVVGWRMVPEFAALAHTALVLWESGGRVSNRSPASNVEYEVGVIESECRWGLRRKMRRVLADYRRLIVDDENRDLLMADPDFRMVFGYEDRGLDTVVAAGWMAVLDRRMKMVVGRFEGDIVALGCESLTL